MKITLDGLEALEAIAIHGSFASAARALHKVQSAISYSIRQLEIHLGVELFHRVGRRAVLTTAGQVLLDESKVLLGRARRIEALASQFNHAWEPRIEVIIDGIFPMRTIMQVLKSLADENVPTQIQIRTEFLGGVQDRFESDGADMMVVKEYVPREDLMAHSLPEMTCLLVAHTNHPLVALGHQQSLTQKELEQHIELTVHESSDSKRLVDTHLFGSQRVFYLSDFDSKRQALLMGLGYGWMPMDLIQDSVTSGELVELNYKPASRFAFTPKLIHRTDRPLGNTGVRFKQLLSDVLTHAKT